MVMKLTKLSVAPLPEPWRRLVPAVYFTCYPGSASFLGGSRLPNLSQYLYANKPGQNNSCRNQRRH